MGIRVTIGSSEFEAESYQVSEDATPIAAGDTTGSVGTITISVSAVDADLFPDSELSVFGPDVLLDEPVTLSDTLRGYTVGRVVGVQFNRASGLYDIDCRTRLGDLIAYGVQAQPFTGTLSGAIEYYLSLAGVDSDFLIDPEIADREVVFPGWFGDLWLHFKELAVSQDCDVALVSGILLFRALRKREAIQGRDISRNLALDAPRLAQSVEVYQYNNEPISNKMVYPPHGWVSETEVFNVEQGGYAEYTVELSASVSTIEQPEAVDEVSPDETHRSVYSIVTDEGEPVSAETWIRLGGRVEVGIDASTTSLIVKITAPAAGPSLSRTLYSVAGVRGSEKEKYPALRILGSGVQFRKEVRRVPTAAPLSKAPTEVGATVDNPFISTANDVFRTGTRIARRYAGVVPELSGSIIAINKREDTGTEVYASYGDVQDFLYTEVSSPTYSSVASYYRGLDLNTYDAVVSYWRDTFRRDDVNQVFGNVQGTRVWDAKSRRWYRIREGKIEPDGISFDADDDLLHSDAQEYYSGRVYSDLQEVFENMTYMRVELAGLYG